MTDLGQITTPCAKPPVRCSLDKSLFSSKAATLPPANEDTAAVLELLDASRIKRMCVTDPRFPALRNPPFGRECSPCCDLRFPTALTGSASGSEGVFVCTFTGWWGRSETSIRRTSLGGRVERHVLGDRLKCVVAFSHKHSVIKAVRTGSANE
jgi:hypothetical protein